MDFPSLVFSFFEPSEFSKKTKYETGIEGRGITSSSPIPRRFDKRD